MQSKNPSYSLILRATIMVWAFLYWLILFNFMLCWSHLICPLEVVPDLWWFPGFFLEQGHWQGLLSVLWVPGTKPMLGSSLYRCTYNLSVQISALSLLSDIFNVYSFDNQIQSTWSEKWTSLPVITVFNKYILKATSFPDLYCIHSSCRMINWTSLSTLSPPQASYPALVH